MANPLDQRSAVSEAAERRRLRAARKAEDADEPSDAENWDIRLGFLIHDVSRLRRIVFDQYVEPLGVTRSQWWVLVYLARHDGMIQSDLAQVLELGKAALGGLIDRLEASGLVERRSDAVDRRVKRVYLSKQATQLIKHMHVKSRETSDKILEGLSVEERNTLVKLLTVVKTNLVAMKRGDGEG